MPVIRSFLLFIATFTLLAACTSSRTPDEGTAGHSFSSFVEDGVPVAVTSDVPKYPGELFAFEEEVRLHQDEANPESLLNRAFTFVRGDDGRYYVPDMGDCRIVVFDETGEYVQSIGRKGEGPGEFRSLIQITVRNGLIMAYDHQLNRSAVFATDGEFLEQHRLPVTNSPDIFHIVQGIFPLAGDCLLIYGTEYDMSDRENQPMCDHITVLSAAGDTLSRMQGEWWSLGKQVRVGTRGSAATHYYGPRSSLQYYEDSGIFAYNTAEPEMKWYDLEGNLQRIIRMDTEPEPVSDAERRGIERLLQQQVEESDDEWRAVREEARRQTVIPEYKSYWSSVSVDDAGYVWIHRHTDYSQPDPYEYATPRMLLSPEGEYLGEMTPPEGVASVCRGHMLVRREDEDTGEIQLLVYRMIPIREGFTYP